MYNNYVLLCIPMPHTTLSIDKKIYKKTAKRAKKQHLSVSAIARMLLDAYAEGKINIMAVQIPEPIELKELSKEDISPELRKEADKVNNIDESQLINIPV